MATYLASIVSQSLTIKADSIEEAEEKYDSYFERTPCPCKKRNCDCIFYDDTDVRHYMEKIDD